MNFDEAITAHAQWKMKLQAYLKKPDDSLDPKVVGADSNCALGKWIYGEGKQYSSLPEYQTLITEHAKFHKAAASVIVKAKSGANTQEDVALGSKSEFGTCSQHVVTTIMKMKQVVK